MNIIPGVGPTLISMIIFVVNYFIIKKLFVTPYLQIENKRHELTKGLKEKAEVMQAQASQSMDSLEKKLKEVSAETKAYTNEKRQEAQDQANLLIGNTKSKALEEIKAARANVTKILEAERNKIVEKTGPLVDGIYKDILKV